MQWRTGRDANSKWLFAWRAHGKVMEVSSADDLRNTMIRKGA
jgi:hypothetical protein